MRKITYFMAAFLLAALTFTSCKKVDDPVIPDMPTDGSNNGLFTINSQGDQVRFAHGNLQYQNSTGTWRIAENQYDVVGSPSLYPLDTTALFVYPGNVSGSDNALILSNGYQGWIDLFGWSTDSTYYGVSTSDLYSDYGGVFVDWGGLIEEGPWRTLTRDEWTYIRFSRKNAAEKYGVGRIMVNGTYVNGCILLSDDWKLPKDLSFTPGTNDSLQYGLNSYSLEEWNTMEAYGAIFLPAAGFRNGEEVFTVGNYGAYWSSSEYYHYDAYDFDFKYDYVLPDSFSSRDNGRCVRLVKPVK